MKQSSFLEAVWKLFVQIQVTLYRLSKGRLLGKHTVLVTTTGRKSGQPRTNVLFAGRDGANYILIASHGGAPKHPAWYLNLTANPHVTLEDHGQVVQTIASTVTDEAERTRLWAKMTAFCPLYDACQRRTERKIPLILLSPQ
jgi:deazaflavin-dependent oxidoreductase (nitroreductase family)